MNKPGSVTGRFTMRDEIESYRRELRWILDEMRAMLAGLTAAQLNWRPDTGRANSACVIVTHVLASTRVYALGFGCGRAVERDRAAEFAATGSDAGPLLSAIDSLEKAIDDAVTSMEPATLDWRNRPPQELWGDGEPREISRREALLESIRHAALHLGELRLTRDLALQASPRGGRGNG
jgi:hypothetical protein